MTETYGRRRGRLAEAKTKPTIATVHGQLQPELAKRLADVLQYPTMERILRAALEAQPVKKKRGRPRKKDVI